MYRTIGVTLVELMVAVLIVSLLAVVAIPSLTGRVDASKWSEAKQGMGLIASALRTYAVEEGDFSTPPTLAQIAIRESDLDGTHFSHDAYVITSASASGRRVSFTITCTAADSTRPGAPTKPAVMTLACDLANSYTPTFSVP